MIVKEFCLRDTTEDEFAVALEFCRDNSRFNDPLGNLCLLHRVHRESSRVLTIGGSYRLTGSEPGEARVEHESLFVFEMTQPTPRLLKVVVDSSRPAAVYERARKMVAARLRVLLEEIRLLYGDNYLESLPHVEADGQAAPQVGSGEGAEQLTPAEDDDSSLIKILFLTANPADRDHLRLNTEMRDIDLALQQTAFRDRFDLKQHWAVQVTDLQHCLLRHQPDIVHFSGHGNVSSEIILEDDSGNSRPVSVRALSKLFSVLKDNIKCVVLNACYSEQQAQAIAQSIDCVIGMSKAIGDDAAIGFATAFYRALGFGRDVKTAFELGCVQIDLEGLDEQDTPKLLALKIPPENTFFIKQAQ